MSLDGTIKMWDAATLELIQCSAGAHDGGKVHCAAIGPDGRLYTGGEDKVSPPLIRVIQMCIIFVTPHRAMGDHCRR